MRGEASDSDPRLRKRKIVTGAVVGVFVIAALLSAAAWLSRSIFGGGCSSRDALFPSTLEKDPVLELHPDGAEIRGRYSGCDPDDGFAFAGRRYLPAGDPSGVVAFYRNAAPGAGWTLRSEDPSPVQPGKLVTSSRLCFTKTIEGTSGYLSLSFPSDFGDNSREYSLELTASHDGTASC